MHISRQRSIPRSDMTLTSTLEILKECYRSIDVRSLIAESQGDWFNLYTVMRFTRREKGDVEQQQKSISERLGSVDQQRVKLLSTTLPAIDADNLMKSFAMGWFDLQGFRIKLRSGNLQNLQTLYTNNWLIERGEYEEYPVWCSMTSAPEVADGFLYKVGINLERLGLPSTQDIATSFLEIMGANYVTDLFVGIPIYLELLTLNLAGKSLLKFSAKVHKALLNKVRFDLARKSGYSTMERKSLNAAQCEHHISEQDMMRVEGQISFQELKEGDSVSAETYLSEIGIVTRLEQAVFVPPASVHGSLLDQSQIRFDVLKEYYEQKLKGENVSLNADEWAKRWGVSKREVEVALIYLVRRGSLSGEFVVGTDVPRVMDITDIGMEDYEAQAEQNKISASEPKEPVPMGQDPRKVFVVHGRNLEARDAIFSFLRSIGLDPIEWSQAVLATGKPTPYVGEVLNAAFSLARAVLVLMTPDDEAQLRPQYRKADESVDEIRLTPQARPNVLFEAGMAMGRDPNRTVLVELGQLRPFSDIGGRHVVKLDDSTQKRQELAQRLQLAKCAVNLSGTNWHTAGQFIQSITPSISPDGTKDEPEGPDIRLEQSDLVLRGPVSFGLNVSYHHKIHFFNYGNADGQLLSVGLAPRQQIPEMAISTRLVTPQSTALPTVIPAKQRGTVELSIDTNANPGQSPPQKLDIEIAVKFEVSTNEGPKTRESTFRFRTQNAAVREAFT